jgi:hypothetical protein
LCFENQVILMLKSFLLFLFFLIAFFLADRFGPLSCLHSWKYVILAFFTVLSYMFHTLVNSSIGSESDNFIQFYLSSVVIRLLACLVFITVALYIKVENSTLFIINFFALYLFFTLFEILGLYRNLRRF